MTMSMDTILCATVALMSITFALPIPGAMAQAVDPGGGSSSGGVTGAGGGDGADTSRLRRGEDLKTRPPNGDEDPTSTVETIIVRRRVDCDGRVEPIFDQAGQANGFRCTLLHLRLKTPGRS